MNFAQIVRRIERQLLANYQLQSDVSAVDFLTHSPYAEHQAERRGFRAVVLLSQQPAHLELGLYFEPKLRLCLERNNPYLKVDRHNIDAMAVAIEEISHFHLILARANQDHSTSQIELEWQAELDKWLVLAQILNEQTGHSHLPQLSHLLFDLSWCDDRTEHKVYERAHRLAARYCYKLLPKLMQSSRGQEQCSLLKQHVSNLYPLTWQQKLRMMAELGSHVA